MAKEKSKKGGRIEGLKTEFGKIVWPTGTAIRKQTIATILVSIVLGLLIVLIDMVVQYGVDILVNL